MTLANMRAKGVRSLWVVCDLCHHEAVMNVDRFGGDVPLPSFEPRMVRTGCGIIGAFARPNWQEQPEQESLTGRQRDLTIMRPLARVRRRSANGEIDGNADNATYGG